MKSKTSNKNNPVLERLAVFSDTHGNRETMMSAIRFTGPYTRIIHLGDGVLNGKEAAENLQLPFTGIMGNEDFGEIFPEKNILEICGFRFLLMHGHQLRINAYMKPSEWEKRFSAMSDAARFDQCDAFFFGHSHLAALEKIKDVILCNPGDQYRGSTLPHSFAAVEIFSDSFSVTLMKRADNNTWLSSGKEVKASREHGAP